MDDASALVRVAPCRVIPGRSIVSRLLARFPGRWLQLPPGLWFHGWLVVVSSAFLWTYSFPGGGDLTFWMASGFALASSALVRVVRLGGWALLGRKDAHAAASAKRFLVAPIGAAIAIALVLTDTPLSARFAISRSAFDNALSWRGDDLTHDRRVGLFTITDIERSKGNVFFYEKHGAFLGDAGFAHLPSGPSSSVRLRFGGYPSFSHLTGDWYTWSAVGD